MEKRYIIFFVLAIAIIGSNMLLQRWLAPQRAQQAAQQAQKAGEKEPGAKPAEGKQAEKADEAPAAIAAEEKPAGEKAAAENPAGQPAGAARPEMPLRLLTLGSADPASPYRMLVTLTSRGAAVERIELNSPRYHDTNWNDREGREDDSGYLGHLAVTDTPDKAGAVVQVVGPGTPAAAAGVKPGDVITAFDDYHVRTALDYRDALRRTRIGQQVALRIAGRDKPVEVTLRPRPVQIVQPERHGVVSKKMDPLSYLITLESVGKDKLATDADELPGITMRTENWELLEVANADEARFGYTLSDHGLEIIKRYRLAKLPEGTASDPDTQAYHLVFTLEIRNIGKEATDVAYRFDGPTGLPTEGSWYTNKIATGGSGLRDVVVGQRQGSSVSTHFAAAATIADDKANIHWQDYPVAFAGVDAIYFASAIVPQHRDLKENWFADTIPVRVGPVSEDKYKKNQTDVTCRLVSQPFSIKPDAPLRHEFLLFAGPKRPSLLEQYDLTGLVNYGWFGFVAEPMLAILHFFYGIIPNYGVAIVLLTVLVRSCMFPISRRQAVNAQKMQELQPEIKRITEKYKNNMEARSKAQQELFRKHNYNPLSGCLPMFLQLPIFIGLYRSLSVDVELRLAPLISESVRWCSNLGAPDMLWYWEPYLPAYFAAPSGWLGPYLNVLPLVTIGLFIWQQKMFMPPPADEQAAMQAKMMQYMMVFMGVMFFKVASGLCMYFIASSLWGIAERKLLPKTKPAVGDEKKTIDVASRPVATSPTNGAGRAKKKSGGKR
ncbi:MAG TPA: YidC/Oxa1 family insertase periplasmic-domain containing protein [Pirellulales bacterium]|jgi:YidC/Oxa1 family membrane protein insertase|nr:YidC/Oxa1 family insertase periplasmic-domain containing protein [Pirellulales bacterium]